MSENPPSSETGPRSVRARIQEIWRFDLLDGRPRHVRWWILIGTALSAMAVAGTGLAILAREPEHRGAIALCFAGAAAYAAVFAVLRRRATAGAVLLELLGTVAFMACVFFFMTGSILYWLIDGLSAAVAVVMVIQILLVYSGHQDGVARLGKEGRVLRVLWPLFPIGMTTLAILAVAFPTHDHGPRFELKTSGALRTIVTAQVAYASENDGLFGPLECLREPAQCLRGYTGPAFLDAQALTLDRFRYRLDFHPGPEQTRASGARGFVSFADAAVPVHPGRSYAVRSFCVDDSGVIRHDPSGRVPDVKNGACPLSMPPND